MEGGWDQFLTSLWLCVCGRDEETVLRCHSFLWGLWSGGPRILHSHLTRHSGVCVVSFPGLLEHLPQNDTPSVLFPVHCHAFLLATLPLRCSLWILKRLFGKSRKINIMSFSFHSSYDPNSARQYRHLCLTREQGSLGRRKKDKN